MATKGEANAKIARGMSKAAGAAAIIKDARSTRFEREAAQGIAKSAVQQVSRAVDAAHEDNG
jgi:hypothetical protein